MKVDMRLKRIALVIGLLLPFNAILGLASDDRPNVVIIISDDMGWNDVGYHGSAVETPHLDQLAADGLRLDRFYVHPICTPTRAAFMTGRLPVRFGLTGPLSNSGDRGLPVEETLLSEVFRDGGYETALIGKWHLGSGDKYHPNVRGFDHFYGHLSGMIDYYDHTNAGTLDWQRNGIALSEEGYSTDLIAEEAIRILEERKTNSPLLLIVSFNAPHGPPQAPEALVEKYESMGQSGQVATRSASIDSMDQAIGRVLDGIRSVGMEENSLVMFFCDNGAKGSKRSGGISDEALPLRGGKGELLEGGIRVPAIIRWPEKLEAGTQTSSFLSALDLLPTLTTAAGIDFEPAEELDGSNRWTPLMSGETERADPILMVGQRNSSAVIEGSLKLIRTGNETLLYDVVEDPLENRDLSSDRPGEVERMLSYLEPFSDLGRRGKKGANPGGKSKSKKRSKTKS